MFILPWIWRTGSPVAKDVKVSYADRPQDVKNDSKCQNRDLFKEYLYISMLMRFCELFVSKREEILSKIKNGTHHN